MIGGSLCTGSGGLDLGLERSLGVRWAWHAEIDEAASQILDARWPGVPNLGDFSTVDWSQVEQIELLAAGFPCQDYSLAGKRKGMDGDHGQVWHSVARAVRALRPGIVIFENVASIINAPGPVGGGPGDTALGEVLADLAELGYRWAYDRLRAADVGAPHGRLRWFCVAALPSAADALGGGVDADGRVRGRTEGASGYRGSASSALASWPEVDVAEDVLADGPGAGTETAADADRRRREQRDEGERGVSVAGSGGAPARLLPTPVVIVEKTDAVRLLPTPQSHDQHAHRARTGGGAFNLNEVVAIEIAPRLLPTPQAADGDGGRQEKSAMGNAGQRPSGQKATLPLPTAVGMREELSETPFSQPAADDDQLVLLPTPVANPENPGAGGELRAALVHGEGRRNETGVDTLGRPNEGRPSKLLPTPTAQAAKHGEPTPFERSPDREDKHNLWKAAAKLLPTPTAQDAANTAGPSQRERHSDPLNVVAADLADPLLPTPQTGNRRSTKAMTASTENGRRSGGGNSSPPGLEQIAELRDGHLPDDLPPYEELPPATRSIIDGFKGSGIEWGVYEPAVRRWEEVFGEAAPVPTDEKGRLAPDFVRWMLGYPHVLEWRPEEMTKDEFIVAAIETGAISVDAERGKVYALRGSGGVSLAVPHEIGTELESGYLAASIRLGGERRMARLHRVVWIAANGIPAEGLFVCHRNNVKTDNRIKNLYLGTPAENARDAARDGLMPTGEDNAATKIDAETRILIRRDYEQGDVTQKQLAERYGISKSRVQQICAVVGWFDVDGVSRTKKLRALGNSVQVQCAEAVGFWTRALIESGLLLSAP